MKKIISFSLWGDCKIYCQGAIENVKLAAKYYPDWIVRFYIDEKCPAINVLRNMDCELVIMNDKYGGIDKTTDTWHNHEAHKNMFWRFLGMNDPEAERVIFRDADSRLNPREADAVKQWEDSGVLGHLIFECQEHWNGIMPGTSGILGGLFPNLESMIDKFHHEYESRYPGQRWVFSDIIFMRDEIFSKINFSLFMHGYGTPNPLRVEMPPGLGRFIGDVVDEHLRSESYG